MRAPRLPVLMVVLLLVVAAPAAATTQTVDDPAGDVQTCEGECSMYDQDLRSVTVDDGGGTISITIQQYGAFAGACNCYYPQVQFYFDSTDPAAPDYYTAAWLDSRPGSYPIGLFQTSVSQEHPCGTTPGSYGGAYGAGKVADVEVTFPDDHTINYRFPAGALPSASFRWRVAEPRQSRC